MEEEETRGGGGRGEREKWGGGGGKDERVNLVSYSNIVAEMLCSQPCNDSHGWRSAITTLEIVQTLSIGL